ncbi:MAG TPA: ABC transporter substrate-binding protein, partial [Streptosporangiaceae bacterium]
MTDLPPRQSHDQALGLRARQAELSRRRLLGVGATLTAGLGLSPLLAACGSSTSSSGSVGSGKAGGTLTMGIAGPPDTLDPGATGLALTLLISMTMFDPLVWWFPGPGGTGSRFVPGLAESYTVSPDASVYTFKLRKGVTFHDGTKFDATAVKATYDHVVDPATKSKSGLGALGPYQETKIIDPYT